MKKTATSASMSRARPALDVLVPFVEGVESFLGLSRSSAYRMLAAGQINVVRIGRRTLIRQSEIARLINEADAATNAA